MVTSGGRERSALAPGASPVHHARDVDVLGHHQAEDLALRVPRKLPAPFVDLSSSLSWAASPLASA
eukprot:8192307-Pyramimonas_sp.AAC.1